MLMTGLTDAIVLAGGDPVEPGDLGADGALPERAYVVAADSGLHQAARLGLHVDRVVGDFDSADPDAVAAAAAAGATLERHPAEKDATDLELALDAAMRAGAHAITVVGGGGGRLDHLLANVAVLTSERYAAVTVRAVVGRARLAVLHGGRPPLSITGPVGSLVTLLAYGGAASGITTTGLQYALAGDDLGTGTARGVSNVLVEPYATIALGRGTLVVIQPGADQ